MVEVRIWELRQKKIDLSPRKVANNDKGVTPRYLRISHPTHISRRQQVDLMVFIFGTHGEKNVTHSNFEGFSRPREISADLERRPEPLYQLKLD